MKDVATKLKGKKKLALLQEITDNENALAKTVHWEAWEAPPYALRNQACIPFDGMNKSFFSENMENEDTEMQNEDHSVDDSSFQFDGSEKDYAFPFNSTIDEMESIDEYDSDFSDIPIEPFVPFVYEEARKVMLTRAANDQLYNDQFAFTKNERFEVQLLHILNKNNCPHNMFGEIISWAREAYIEDYDFKPIRKTRENQIKFLQKWLSLEYMEPELCATQLPSEDCEIEMVPVTRFDFATMLVSLLTDHRFIDDLANFDVPQDDPFGRFQSEDGALSEFNSGEWYDIAYANCINSENDFLVPIIFAIDEAKLQIGGKQGCCPIVFYNISFYTRATKQASSMASFRIHL